MSGSTLEPRLNNELPHGCLSCSIRDAIGGAGSRHGGGCFGERAEDAPAGDAGKSVPLRRDPQQAANRLVQEYGLAERAAEFIHGRVQDHPEGDSRHEHWREVMALVQKTRRRKMERRHLSR
jgi:hypothetical protein